MENKKYNPEGSDLRKFQLRMLEILKIVDGICRKHNIPYWLSSGTLLGAVRHGGFIPWDDDMDIEVKKQDYKRLLKILEKELPEDYKLQSFHVDKAYAFLFAKVRNLKSELKESDNFDIDYKYKGAFVDIFPMEYASAKAAKLSDYAFKIMYFMASKLRLKHVRGRSFLVIMLHCFLLLTSCVCRCFPVTRKNRQLSSLCSNFHYIMDREDIFPLKQIKFENYSFYAPSNVNAYLINYFGNDYMQLPKEENRIWHGTDFKVW